MIRPQIIKRNYSSEFEANILLRKSFKQKFFGIIIDFGSSDQQKLPGSAHFLEHKLFAKEDGDIAHKFEELGADVNAYTSFNETMYYCSGINHTKKLIDLLFELVGKPYFTDKNVNQEKPIIQQELAMYQDEPNWEINNALMIQMFGDTNLGIDVAGTKSSIDEMTKAELIRIYKEKYIAPNMKFIATGDFSDEEIEDIFKQVGKLQSKYLSANAKKSKNSLTPIGEMKDVVIDSTDNSNIFGIGVYLKNFKKVLASSDLAQIILEIMLESKLSVTSPWFERMNRKKLLINPLQISVNYTRQGNFINIFGISEHSDEVIAEIKNEIEQLELVKSLSFSRKFFELKKKECIANFIREMDNLSSVSVDTLEALLDKEDPYENLRNLQTMSFENYCKFYKELMTDSQICSAHFKNRED